MTPLILLALLFQAPPTYSVGGTVVDSVTGAPLVRTRVIIGGATSAMNTPLASRTAITGADGRFHFDGLHSQKYTLSAERPGYATQTFGQRALYEPYSTAIMTGEGQATDNLIFRMIPSAVITGAITDTRGDPVPGMTVTALQISGFGARRRIVRQMGMSTDDRGVYRLPSLPAGTYDLVISGSPARGLPVPGAEEVAYPRTFYPGTTDPDQAQTLSVQAGQEARADLVLRPVPCGKVVGTAPNIPQGRQVYAFLEIPTVLHGEIPAMPSVWLSGGQFQFESVPAGKYTVYLMDDTKRVAGAADVVVNGSGETRVTVGDATFPQVTMHIMSLGEPRYATATRIAGLVPVADMLSPVVAVAPDGTAIIPQVRPGKYEVKVGQGRDLAIVGMKVQGAAATGQLVDIPGTGPVEMNLIVDAAAEDLSGRVVADGKPQAGVIAMLVQKDGWQFTGSYRFDQSDSDGTFRWAGVPAGQYLMFAIEKGLFEDYDGPDAIRKLLPIGQPLTVTGDAAQSVELKLLPMPAGN